MQVMAYYVGVFKRVTPYLLLYSAKSTIDIVKSYHDYDHSIDMLVHFKSKRLRILFRFFKKVKYKMFSN